MITVVKTCQSTFNHCSFHNCSIFKSISLFLLMAVCSLNTHASDPLVNINRAGVEELAENLSGVGPAKARAIVVYRELHGPFETVNELIKVKGIGPRTLEKNRARLIVDATDWFARDHNANAVITSDRVHSPVDREKEARRVVRSVIKAARRDSITRRH